MTSSTCPIPPARPTPSGPPPRRRREPDRRGPARRRPGRAGADRASSARSSPTAWGRCPTATRRPRSSARTRPPRPRSRRLNASLGLNHPLVVQYWNWLVKAAQGNLGRSYFTQIPVSQSIAQRLPVDLSIAVLAVILAVIIGGGAGTIAAVRRGGWFDRTVTAACSAASTLPAFVVGIILVVLFAVTVHLLPANGYVGPSTSVLAVAGAHHPAQPGAQPGGLGRHRAPAAHLPGRGARAELHRRRPGPGPAHRRILVRHALRNGRARPSPSWATTSRSCWPGAVAAEAVFSLPGLGQLLLESAQTRDIPVVQGLLLVVSCFVDRGQPDGERSRSTGCTARTTGPAHDGGQTTSEPDHGAGRCCGCRLPRSPSPCCSASPS